MKEKLMRRRRLVLGEKSGDEMEAAEEVQWSWKREALQRTLGRGICFYSRRSIVEQIAEELKLTGDGVYQEFLNSCFGFLMRFDTQGLCPRSLLHWLFAHEVIRADAGPDELWYHVCGRFIRFSNYEYALVTGLSFGPTPFDPSAEHKPPAEGLFLRHYGGRRLKMETLRHDFTEGVFRESSADALKVAKLLIVYFLLFGMDGRQSYIDEWAWTLIEDTDQWETFMWGKYTYQILLSCLQRLPTELLHSVAPCYRVNGYVWAFLIWVFEAIPELGNAFGVRTSEDVLPRCLRWRFQKTPVSMGGFVNLQMEVHTTLESSAEEKRQPYWKHIHDDLRSGVCYIPPHYRINKRTLSINPSSRDVFPVSRPQGSKVIPTPHFCSTSAKPMRFKKKRKRTGPLTTHASLRDEIPKRSAGGGLIQKKMPASVQQELFSQRCGVASTDPLSPILGAKSSKCQLKCLKKDTLETNSSRFLKTDDTIERLRTRPDFFIDESSELSKKGDINLRHEKLAAIKSVEELRLKQLDVDKVVEELKRKNLEANLKLLESDKAVELYKSRLENLSSKIMKTEKRDNLDIRNSNGGKYNPGNGSTPEDAENAVVMSRGVFTKSSELSKKENIKRNAKNRRKLRSHTKISSSAGYRRKLRSHAKIGSMCSDGIASDSEAVSRSSRPHRRPRRLRKKGPLSPVKLDSSFDRCSHWSTSAPLLRGNLSGNLFTHCFEKIWSETPEEKTNPCAYLNCMWFYMYSTECYRERVVSWIKNENIFSKRYVFVPIVLWSHWSLLIFCHLGESLESKTRTPCMLLLDSLHELNRSGREALIRRFISDIYKAEGRPESDDMVQDIPLLVPNDVPQQRNYHECGIFVLLYTNLFLKSAPDNFSISRGYPYFMKEDWFTEDELERFYKRLESFGPVPIDTEPSDCESSLIVRIDREEFWRFRKSNC